MNRLRDKIKDLYTWDLLSESFKDKKADNNRAEKNSHTPVEKTRPSIPQRLAGSFSKKLKILAEAIEELDKEIKNRIRMYYQFQARINGEISRLEVLLEDLDHFGLGYRDSIEHRRLGLEREILNLKKEKRSESLRAWEDIVSLLKAKRQLVMEYQNLVNTRDMLDT